jgi:phenylpyruvate tautomerase PptA (4-oxalocrotonate tautomerase family)
MPLVRIDMYKGRTKEQKKVILDVVHQSLVEAFKIPEDDRNQRIYEIDECNFEVDGIAAGGIYFMNTDFITIFQGGCHCKRPE